MGLCILLHARGEDPPWSLSLLDESLHGEILSLKIFSPRSTSLHGQGISTKPVCPRRHLSSETSVHGESSSTKPLSPRRISLRRISTQTSSLLSDLLFHSYVYYLPILSNLIPIFKHNKSYLIFYLSVIQCLLKSYNLVLTGIYFFFGNMTFNTPSVFFHLVLASYIMCICEQNTKNL
jgi:hypothetical protein